jgi:hypothetical protein
VNTVPAASVPTCLPGLGASAAQRQFRNMKVSPPPLTEQWDLALHDGFVRDMWGVCLLTPCAIGAGIWMTRFENDVSEAREERKKERKSAHFCVCQMSICRAEAWRLDRTDKRAYVQMPTTNFTRKCSSRSVGNIWGGIGDKNTCEFFCCGSRARKPNYVESEE